MVGNTLSPNQFYRNDGGFNFTKITDSPISTGSASTLSLAWGDMDGDGDLVSVAVPQRSPNVVRVHV